MSSVTFSTAVGGDGSTVTDDNNATTGLREGGWKTRFVPCFTQQVAVANYIVTKAGEAESSATAAAASYDSFDDRYLGAKASNPTLDNDGNALLTGAIYWNTVSNEMLVWSGTTWVSYNPAISYLPLSGGVMTGAITFNAGQTFTGTLPLSGGVMTGAITFNAGQTFTGTLPLSGGTMTGQLVLPGSSSAIGAILTSAAEVTTIAATAATGTINYDATTQSVLYYTTSASANWTVNFRASSGTTLNAAMVTGQSVTAAFLVTQGGTAYYNSVVKVDGSTVTPKFQGGTAYTAGNASSIDVYMYTIIKTGNAAFTVFTSQTKFA